MSRIKCPRCGSTAQIEVIYFDASSYSTRKSDDYVCGCGCEFEVVFEVTEINILNEEG